MIRHWFQGENILERALIISLILILQRFKSPNRRQVLSNTVSITSSLLMFFISAIALMEITALAGSLRSSGDGPKTGLSVSTSRQERGRCFISFCFCLERTIDAIDRLRISGSIDPRALPGTKTSWAIEPPDLMTWRFKLLSHHYSTDLFTPLLSV